MDTPNTEPTLGRDRSLGDVLRDARLAKGLELSDIAEITHVRKDFLQALEEERYDALPEDIYTRNFLKLFAQSVGLKEASVLELYKRGRGRGSAAPSEDRAPAPSDELGSSRERAPRRARPPLRVGAWLPTLLLIAAVVVPALWAFRSLLFTPTRVAPEVTSPIEDTVGTASEGASEATPSATPVAEEALSSLNLSSEPPGAEVIIDGFPLGATPIEGLPLTPGENRSLRLSLAGYEPYEAVIDLSSDQTLFVELTPLGQAAPDSAGAVADTAAAPATEAATPAETPPAASSVSGQLVVTISAPTWLEAYASTARNVGERLVYTTVQPGQSFDFELPVYLHVGNAGGVNLTLDGQDIGALGSSGEVISRAFSQ